MRHFIRLFLLLLALLWLRPALAVRDIHVVHFVLDGLRHDVLHEQLEQGKLPHLRSLFYEKGAVFEKALTTAPTVSSPGYVSFVTGLGAGNSGIFFLEWFDRTQRKPVGYLSTKGYSQINDDLLNRLLLKNHEKNVLYTPNTFFELLKGEPTAAIYTPFRKGATVTLPKKFPIEALWSGLIAKDGDALNRQAMKELRNLFDKRGAELPRYTLVALYGTDFIGHKEGPDSEELHWNLELFDRQFEKFYAQLAKKGLLENTYIILSSDHGMHPTGKRLDLRKILWNNGVTKRDPVYVTNRGVSSTFIYVAGERGWEDLPTLHSLRNFRTRKGNAVDLVQLLASHEAIDWIAARDRLDHVRIFGDNGEGVLSQVRVGGQTFYAYEFRGEDPLGYGNNPNLDSLTTGRPLSPSVWFQKTIDETHPNAVVEISNLFNDPKAGDILVVAEDAWGFRKAKAGTHGGLKPGDMHIPLWVLGPDIPAGIYQEAKSVDLYPTVLGWFGFNEKDLPQNEGVSLFAKSRNVAVSEATEVLAALENEMMKHPRLHHVIDKTALSRKIKSMVPAERRKEVLDLAARELETRYRTWKKLRQFGEETGEKENRLGVPKKLRKNMEWVLTKEQNLEFFRLRRMEDIQTILKDE